MYHFLLFLCINYNNGGKEIQKHDITHFLNDLLNHDDFQKILKNGFQCCLLSPFDPNAVNNKKCKMPLKSYIEET